MNNRNTLSRRIASVALAGIMLASAALTSCSKKEAEPPKSKRTNVYAGDEIALSDGIDYISNTAVSGDKIYATYSTTYTLTINELGEEVERRVGYYWEGSQEYEGVVEEVVGGVEDNSEPEIDTGDLDEDEGITDDTTDDSNGDGILDDDMSVDAVDDESTSSLPDGWYYDYISVMNVMVYDYVTGESYTVALPDNLDGYMNSLAVDSDGKLMLIYVVYNWDSETGVSSNVYTIYKYDTQTEEITEQIDLTTAMTNAGVNMENVYINYIRPGSNGDIVVVVDDGFMMFDSALTLKYQYTIENGWINNISFDGDKIYITYYENSTSKLSCIENGEKTDFTATNISTVLNNMYSMLGFKNGLLYYRAAGSVNVYDFVNDTISEEMNFINSDIQQNNISDLLLLPDGKICLIMFDYSTTDNGSNCRLSVMERVPDEELQDEIIVTVGTLGSYYNVTNAIIKYNKLNTGIRVSLLNYSQYNSEENEYKGGLTKLNNDIITGDMPDIILLNSSMPVDSYFKKGVFTDLNQFVDDPEIGIDRSKYLSNVFDACTVDGNLYSIILSFSLRTIMAKSEFVGDEPGWTFDEMMELINNMPEGSTAFYDSGRNDIISTFFSSAMSSFIDWETGETYFESEGFINFIKYLATCPEKGVWEEYYDSMGDNYEYDADAEQEISQKYEMRFYKNYGLLDFTYLSSFSDYLYNRNYFATNDVTAIGFPTDSGNGAVIAPNMEFAISYTSQVKEQAWEVIKSFMEDDDIAKRNYYFSTNIEFLESQAANAKDRYYSYGIDDSSLEWYKNNGYSDEYIDYLKNSNQPFDEESVQKCLELVKGATKVNRSDDDLVEIINEELSGFFGGTKSAEETAKVIASRAKIYISEHS